MSEHPILLGGANQFLVSADVESKMIESLHFTTTSEVLQYNYAIFEFAPDGKYAIPTRIEVDDKPRRGIKTDFVLSGITNK